jgi:hypothetical protein
MLTNKVRNPGYSLTGLQSQLTPIFTPHSYNLAAEATVRSRSMPYAFNWQDLDGRGVQVSHMSRIYREAQLVFAWLRLKSHWSKYITKIREEQPHCLEESPRTLTPVEILFALPGTTGGVSREPMRKYEHIAREVSSLSF